ncbi:MAG: hypothetical protein HUU21_25515 [Polyangiaceae bacterium]|nr:hypothetical protein [Polyangiaceae bacterium]NUQ76908.1 hypothetical protein [Polyangiaceae bacterium]
MPDETSTKKRRKSLIARGLKGIGYLTDPKTTPGKAFTWWETKATKVFEKLAHNDMYLNFAGRSMERTFRAHAETVRALEQFWHLFRLPTSTDVVDLREQVHHLNDQVEAMSAQMELLLDEIAAQRGQSKDGGSAS